MTLANIATFVVLFLALAYEIFALVEEKPTISRLVHEASRIFPMLPWITGSAVHAGIAYRFGWRAFLFFAIGTVTGGLAVHFWWHWCP